MMTMNTSIEDIQEAPLQTDFYLVAMSAIERGFKVTLLVDKKPRLHKWNKPGREITTETEVRDIAKDFPHADVGLVLRREVNEPFAVDVDRTDEDGLDVIQRYEQETGNKFPKTYEVLTRPVTNNRKKHIFLRHTDFSVALFSEHKVANHNLGEYDLIGTGYAGKQVVSENCVRQDTHEVRTGNGEEIANCPDKFAEWLLKDITRLKQLNRENNKKIDQENEKALDEGRPIRKGTRTRFLGKLAEWLVKFRLERQTVYEELIRQCSKYCEDGKQFAESKEGRDKLHDIAFNSFLKQGNVIAPGETCRVKTIVEINKNGKALKLSYSNPKEDRQKAIQKAIGSLPDKVTADQGYLATGFDKTLRKDQIAFSRAMGSQGFEWDASLKLWCRG